MPIEDVFSIQGRGTVVTGRVETGVVKVAKRYRVPASFGFSLWWSSTRHFPENYLDEDSFRCFLLDA